MLIIFFSSPKNKCTRFALSQKNLGGRGYVIYPTYGLKNLLQTVRYMVVPKTSPRLAAKSHKESSPLSVVSIGRDASRERTSAISRSSALALGGGHSPKKAKNGSFSTCHLLTEGTSRYRVTMASIIGIIFSTCFSSESVFAHSGTWHSGQRGTRRPMAIVVGI